MAKLIVENNASRTGASIGGRPLAPVGTAWPQCKACGAWMQFLAQIPLDSVGAWAAPTNEILLVFQCQADPGMCDDFDPNSGGNAVLLVQANGLAEMSVPEGVTLLPRESKASFESYDDSVCNETSDDNYCTAYDEPGSMVLGKVGGEPMWIQGDETPRCHCGDLMSFVAQIEERGGGGINFGDAGAGYAFMCGRCHEGKFLWQCA